MGVIAALNPTLMDVAKLKEPNGGTATDIVEMLFQSNPILTHGSWKEANGRTFHRSTTRTGIPSPTWRMFYQGVQPSKSTYAQVDEPIGMMEARGQIDKKLADLETDPAMFRLTEADGHIEGMNQDFVRTLLYGTVSTSPQKFNGIMPRYSLKSAPSGENIIDAGGTGSDNTSILIVEWGPRAAMFIYPTGSTGGLNHTDLGINHQAIPPDGTSGYFSAYEDKWEWDCGFVLRDWRRAVRIANIDVSNLKGQQGATDLIDNIVAGLHKFPTINGGLPGAGSGGRQVIYMSRGAATMLDIQARKQSNVHVTTGMEEGAWKTRIRGVEVVTLDQLLETETRVV